MQGGRDRACAQLFRRGVAAGLFSAILCFAAGAASAQESTKASTKASAQVAAKASAQVAAKTSTKAPTKASTQAATKASALASTKASSQASVKESAKASAPAAKASAQESVKEATKGSTKASSQAPLKASAQESAKASAKASAQESEKESAKASPQDASAQRPLKFSGSQLEPVKWSELAGWTADDHLAAFAAYRESCRAARKTPRADDRATISAALWNVCRDAMALRPQDGDTARGFFERNFQPVRIARLGEAAGLLTGYFEPIVAGSRLPSPEFHVPVYRRPRDLVAVGYKPASVAFPN